MEVREVPARAALLRSRIPGNDYAVNPYGGCGHGCLYCYMRVIDRNRRGPARSWGRFVDVRVNTPALLLKELRRRPRGRVMLSSSTDPYQPLEARFQLTRACLELFDQARFPVSLLTKSALILRDLDLLRQLDELDVGITITTNDENIRRFFEPGAIPIPARLQALQALARAGLSPYVFVGPVLPQDPAALAREVEPYASFVYLDKLNYSSLVEGQLRRWHWDYILKPGWVEETAEVFRAVLGAERVEVVCG